MPYFVKRILIGVSIAVLTALTITALRVLQVWPA